MASPLEGTFFHFEEDVGVGEAWKGLPMPCVKHLGDLIIVKTLFSSKLSSANEWHLTTKP
jgi:hypothetical protein